MTTDLVKFEWFDYEKEARPVRFVEQPDKTFIPVNDIAQATGVRKRALLTILEKNEIDFREHQRDVRLSTPGGYQQVRCVDRDGAMMLLFKISTGHIKREDIRTRLNLFKEWQITKMGQPIALPAPVPEVPKGPDYPGIIQKLKFIRSVHEETGWNLLELQKEVLREAGMISLTYHIEPDKPALPLAPKHKDYLTAKDIGELCGKSAHEIYMFLYQQKPPLVIMDAASGFRLTDAGREYGSEYAVDVGDGAVLWRIRWKKGILMLFNIHEGKSGIIPPARTDIE